MTIDETQHPHHDERRTDTDREERRDQGPARMWYLALDRWWIAPQSIASSHLEQTGQ